MNPKRVFPSISLMILVVSGCQTQSKAAEDSPPSTKQPADQRCTAAGGGVDSTFAIEQARRALSQPGVTLAPRLIQPVRDQGIELGLLISLAVTEPRNVVGGGGLAWVDLESGCAIVLRRYE